MYIPGPPPQGELTVQQIWEEFNRISNYLNTGKFEFIEFTTHNNEPSKPINGRVYRADGINWNPGNGQGLYVYEEGWVPLATTIKTMRPPMRSLSLTGVAPYVHYNEILEQIPSGALNLTGSAPSTSITL